MLTVNSSILECTGYSLLFLSQGPWPLLPNALYDRETLGTGRQTESPEGNAENIKEIFEIMRRSQESAPRTRHFNVRRSQWKPRIGDVVWAKGHHLSKAADWFAAKLDLRFDGPYQVVDFGSPLICKVTNQKDRKERTVHISDLQQQDQVEDDSEKEDGDPIVGNGESRNNSIREWMERVIHQLCPPPESTVRNNWERKNHRRREATGTENGSTRTGLLSPPERG